MKRDGPIHHASWLIAVSVAVASVAAQSQNAIERVKSADGVMIAVECTGRGPTLLLVHGGTGDRTRWTPLFPLFASNFTVCAMDRRGHGLSEDSERYTLQKEAEDVAAVVNTRRTPVFVLGHSYGAVAALEAAFLTPNIAKLVLYEPPLREADHTAVTNRIERLLRAGEREQALVVFMQEVVQISPGEVAAMKRRPSWPGLLATIGSQIRQLRALNEYRFEAARMRGVALPTLLLTGSKSVSPELKRAIASLMATLPNRRLEVFDGQEHNAMDAIPTEFARVVTTFALEKN